MDDPDQLTTYAAEDLVTAWLDATCPSTGEVHVTLSRGGHSRTVTFLPESEPLFTGPSEVGPFVDRVLVRLRSQAKEFGSNYRGREQKPVRVLASRGFKKAEYHEGTILLPERQRGGAWALRGMVVLHELAHHLNTGIDGAIIDHHGEGFRQTFLQLLEDIGWNEIAAMLREAYGQVGLNRQADDEGMLAKVGKLLRHAEGASTEAERDAFFTKAQQLATAHSIELAVARAAHENGAAALTPVFESVKLGHRGQQSNVRFIELMLAITRANDLRCTIRGDNTAVTMYGFRSDIDVAKTLYVSLVVQMVADADAYIRSGAHRPVHGRTARAAFYAGWTDRIGQRLHEAQREAQRELGALTSTTDQRTGQVSESKSVALVAKDIEVDDYFAAKLREHRVRGSWRGSSGVSDGHSHARGQAAAQRARLGRERELSA